MLTDTLATALCGDGNSTSLSTCTAIGATLGTGCHFIGSGPTSTCVSPTACSDGDATNTATCAAIGTGLGSGCHLVGTGSTSTCVAGNVFGVSRLFAHDWFPCLDVTSKIARVPPYADTLRRLICSHCVRRRQRHHLGHLHCNRRNARHWLPLHRLGPYQHLCSKCVSHLGLCCVLHSLDRLPVAETLRQLHGVLAASVCGDGNSTNTATCAAIGAALGTGCHLIGSGPTSTCVAGARACLACVSPHFSGCHAQSGFCKKETC